MKALMKLDISRTAVRYSATALLFISLFAAPAYGQGSRSITIETEPRAKVWINGVLYGTASAAGSLTVRSVSPGRKTIRVRADGFKEAEKALTATQSGTISLPLTKTADEAELAFQMPNALPADREGDPGYQSRSQGLLLRRYIGRQGSIPNRRYRKADKASPSQAVAAAPQRYPPSRGRFSRASMKRLGDRGLQTRDKRRRRFSARGYRASALI